MNRLFVILFLVALTSFVYAQTPEDFNKRGIELGNQNKFEDAITEFDRAISEHDRTSAIAYHNKAWAQERQGDLYNAIQNYEEAFRRNPQQVLSAERLGYLYYQTGNYIKAVDAGEAVLYIDPTNDQVVKWLPDAYAKKLNQERELRLSDDSAVAGRTPSQTEEKRPPKRKTIIEGGFDFTLRFGYFYEESKFMYIKTMGMIADIPETVWVNFTPTEAWKFSFVAQNPRLGLMAPNLLVHQEKIESVYNLKSISIGLGFLLSHHNSNINNDIKYNVVDFKTGFLFSYRNEKDNWDVDIAWYPRLFPHDGTFSKGKTMDTGSLDVRWTNYPSNYLKYYSLFSFKDFYFFDHEIKRSNWFGVYDIGLGLSIGNIKVVSDNHPFTFVMEYRQRFYMRDFVNSDPYSLLPNGQGWFGLNFQDWFKGSPITGVHSMGSEFTLRIEEQISPYFALYQALILEAGYKNAHGIETSFQIGVKGMY